MIAAGSGNKQVELDENASAIEGFISVVETGSLDVMRSAGMTAMVDLACFVRKYNCKAATGILVHFILECPCSGYDDRRLLAAAHLDRPHLCRYLIERNHSARTFRSSADPNSPFTEELLAALPAHYSRALKEANVSNKRSFQIEPGPFALALGPGARFLHFLRKAIEGD